MKIITRNAQLTTSLLLLFLTNIATGQNSLVGDGFGGRLWYQPTNYGVGSYSAYTVCGVNNQLYSWGVNVYGQLGTGGTVGATEPVTALGMTDVVSYSSGYASAAIKSDGSAWAWGNTNPVLTNIAIVGTGLTNLPQQVISSGVKFCDAGIDAITFVKYDGTVWTLGDNTTGVFGNGTYSDSAVATPTQMSGINTAVRAVVCNYNWAPSSHYIGVVVLLSDGTLMQSGGYQSLQPTQSLYPTPVPGLNGVFIVDIKAGTGCVYALSSTGEVYVWGMDYGYVGGNHFGYLGLGDTIFQTYMPTQITFPPGAGSIVALSSQNDGINALALDEFGNVYGWGYGAYGLLGLNNTADHFSPVLIYANAKDILCGETFSYVIKDDNTIWASGRTTWNVYSGSIWMDLSNIQRNSFTQIHPLIPPMNLCNVRTFGTVSVKLISFEIGRNLNGVGISWSTTDEINIKQYELEYSYNQNVWEKISLQQPKNGANNVYTFSDHFRYDQRVYYRLKIVDNDGHISYSTTKNIFVGDQVNDLFQVHSENNKIHIVISTELKGEKVILCLFSSEGKLISKEEKFIDTTGFYLTNVPHNTGIYYVKLITKDKSDSKKLIW